MMSKNPWDKTNFACYWLKYWRQPGRPIQPELDYLGGILLALKKRKNNPQVLVLGSTSEYRDLMIDLGIKATVVDFSFENYQILSRKMKHSRTYHKYEEFIQQKWQRLDIGRKFDLILGHFALNVIEFRQWESILRRVAGYLDARGAFLPNCWIRPNDYSPTLRAVLQEYQKKWKTQYDLWSAMMPKIYFAAYNSKKEEMTYPALCRIFENARKNKLITKHDYQHYLEMGYRHFNFRLIIPQKNKVVTLFRKYFILKKIIYFRSWPSNQYMPSWYLVKKEKNVRN